MMTRFSFTNLRGAAKDESATAATPAPLFDEGQDVLFLSVVVPAYNESHRLASTLERMTAYLAAQPYRWEIIISDDGSADDTCAIAGDWARDWSEVRVLAAARNEGKGAAVQRGVLAARGAYVLFSDADLSTPIAEVAKLLTPLRDGYDIAIGSRALGASRVARAQPLPRRVMGAAFHRIVRDLALHTIRDSQCGFKAFRTPVARHISGQLTVKGFAFDIEALLLADALGYRVKEVGVAWADVAGTRVEPFRDSLVMLRDTYALRRGVAERLDVGQEQTPGPDDLGAALITLRQTGGRAVLPIDDVVRTARRVADTVVLDAVPGSVLLAVFAVTPREAERVAQRFAAATSRALAARGEEGAITSDTQVLPLSTPMNWLHEPAAAHDVDISAALHGADHASDALLSRLALGEQRREAEIRAMQRREETWARRRVTVRVLIAANIVGLVWWLSWLFNPHNAATGWLYTLLVLAECFNIVQVLGYWYTVWHERAPERKRARVEGRVDVFITTYNEPVDLVEQTVRAALAMPYPHRTYVLDDGNRPEMGAMAARVGAHWLTRPNNRGAKAGNINHALGVTDGDFFVVFDADHVPRPHFLARMMPFMADPRVAFVQAPQYYANRDQTYIAGGAMDQQELFFGPICKGKDGLGAVFCCGTNMVIRRAAIAEIGGFSEESITEDAVTSVALHERGWTSRYVGERLADGLAPEDLGAYISQQRRWARGNIELLLRLGVLRRHMPLRLRFQYAWSAMYYLTSLTTILYLALPCLFLIFGLQTVRAASDDYVGHFLPYIFLTIFILARSAEGRLRFRAMQLSYGLFPVFLGALYSVVTGRKVGFVVTPKERSVQSFYHLVIPQLVAVGLSVLAIVIGFAHYSGARTITNACWALFNILMLSAMIHAAVPSRTEEVTRKRAVAGEPELKRAERISA